MKIIDKENKRVYIQIFDLRYLAENNFTSNCKFLNEAIKRVKEIPKLEYEKIKNNFIDTSEKEEYVHLSNMDEIIDYYECMDKSVEELELIIEEKKQEFALISEKLYKAKINMNYKLNQYSYIIESIENLIKYKRQILKYNFPIIRKNDGFYAEYNGYNIYETVNPDVIAFERLDGKETTKNEVPAVLFTKNINKIISNDINKNKYLDGYSATISETEDKKRVLITLKEKKVKDNIDNRRK